MSDEKPLHVQVAEALGCKVREIQVAHPVYPMKIEGPVVGVTCGCDKWPGHRAIDYFEEDGRTPVYGVEFVRYDTDWAATGPLIEKYGIAIAPEREMTTGMPIVGWHAWSHASARAIGVTPLEAVGRLILALKEAGRL